MTKLEEFSSTSTAQRIALAVVAIGLVAGSLPASNAYADTKPLVAIEQQVAAVKSPLDSEMFNFPTIRQDVAQRRQACTEVVGGLEASAKQILDINNDTSLSPPDRLAGMIDVAQKARDAAGELKIQPDPWRQGLEMPFDMGLDSVAHQLKDSIRDYIGNAGECVRVADYHLKSLNAPEMPTNYTSSAHHSHGHGHDGLRSTRNILGGAVILRNMVGHR